MFSGFVVYIEKPILTNFGVIQNFKSSFTIVNSGIEIFSRLEIYQNLAFQII